MIDVLEQIKYCAAKAIIKKRDEIISKGPNKGKGITWAQWWEKKFSDNYINYVKRKQQERAKDG